MGDLISAGFNAAIVADEIIAIVPMGTTRHPSAAMTRLKKRAKERDMLIDTTGGRRIRAIVVTKTNHVILSAIQAHTLSQRYIALDMEYEIEETGEPEAGKD